VIGLAGQEEIIYLVVESFMDCIQNFIIILLLTIAIGKRTFHLVSYSISGQLNLRTTHGLMSIRLNIVH
jgi:hypothetical protein